MKVSIGKNTLGGGKKMQTELRNYNRSTHDLSFIMRTTMAPGVLVPTLKLKMLPGDTFKINTRCHTLTHPTIGPLFGSFKQQNDFFFCPDRLYQALLHNNALNIGLDMKKVKYPIVEIDTTNWSQIDSIEGSNGSLRKEVHPSSLPSYLGYKRLTKNEAESNAGIVKWNATPIIAYYDIFKNYYANKQEENFYTIGSANNIPFNQYDNTTVNTYSLAFIQTDDYEGKVYTVYKQITKNYGSSTCYPASDHRTAVGLIINLAKNTNPPLNIEEVFVSINLQAYYQAGNNTLNINKYKEEGTIKELTERGFLTKATLDEGNDTTNLYVLTNPSSVGDYPFTVEFIEPVIVKSRTTQYNSYPLEAIDELRENILMAGKTQYIVQDTFITDIFNPLTSKYDETGTVKRPACSYPMTGLALKTYQSDINTNWINTEWIEGESGINAITAIDTSSGSFTLDTLNLAKKVYTMLNRIAVSDGSYNAWIQTVYASGGLNHIETPIYLGGSSLEIEFQEVINNSGTEEQPLGSLAGRGIASNHKGGHVYFKADEPGYIMCITSITPRVDYFQGNEWDLYLDTLDDLHKPQLDGIGFQDRLWRYMNANDINWGDIDNLSVGKQPAWIDYMTNVNKTYGNFALIENEGWMCLNRVFGNIDTYTTYIFPDLYNNIFADTEITAQNFWVQIGFNIEARRVMSAKIIPNI